jgi:ABC-type Na+ efflux pump permease subunit
MPNLIWKEWHEQRWKLAFGCIVLTVTAFVGLSSRLMPDDITMMWVCLIGILLPVTYATGLVPAERGEGTMESLLSLPVSPLRILLAKTLMGLVLCIAPLLLAALVSLLVTQGREITQQEMLGFYARSTLTTISLFIWMIALTIRLPNETRGALLAVGILVFWGIGTPALAYPPLHWLGYGLAASPLSFVHRFYGENSFSPPLVLEIAVQAAVAVLLWWWASRNLASPAEDRT